MRMQGSSALELCSVAMGRLDAFYEVRRRQHWRFDSTGCSIVDVRIVMEQFGIQAWDIAAAVVILHEAGGLAVDPAAFNGQRT